MNNYNYCDNVSCIVIICHPFRMEISVSFIFIPFPGAAVSRTSVEFKLPVRKNLVVVVQAGAESVGEGVGACY